MLAEGIMGNDVSNHLFSSNLMTESGNSVFRLVT